MPWTEPRTFVAGEIITATQLNTHLRDNMRRSHTLGEIVYLMTGTTATERTHESRFLELNGVNVSRTTYADLLAWIISQFGSTVFGAGDGVTTFGIPDMRGRLPVGVGGLQAINADDGLAAASRDPLTTSAITVSYGTRDPGGGVGGGVFMPTDPTTATQAAHGPAFKVAGAWWVAYRA